MRYQPPPARSRGAARAAFAGLLVAASLPPWGWWPLGLLGSALLVSALDGQPWKRRVLAGAMFGVAQFVVGLWWMREFTLPGYILCTLLQASFFAAGAVLVHPRRVWTIPAALVVAEAARSHWPLGGLPLSGAGLGQVGGPLAPVARVGSELLIVAAIGVVGVALVAARGRRWPMAAGALTLVVVAAVAGVLSPSGRERGTLRIAAVQGGGMRGYRAVDTDPGGVFDAHVRATDRVRSPVDVVLWPEDVVDVIRLDDSEEARVLAGEARVLNTTLVAGIVEDDGESRFLNAAVAWGPSGSVVARYDKVHRVPFGEYIPARGLVKHFGNVDAVPRDAKAGTGPGVLRTPAGRLGVVISYEVFFTGRARAAARAGGQVLLVPTNASSFKTSQIPGQELAAARLRAIETGRTTIQAAPTGYTAVVDHAGNVVARSKLGPPAVIHTRAVLRTGTTLATTIGPWPLPLGAILVLAAAWYRRRAPILER